MFPPFSSVHPLSLALSRQLWTRDGACVATLKGHRGGVTCVDIAATGRVVSGALDGDLRIWDRSSGAVQPLSFLVLSSRCLEVCPSHSRCLNPHELR